jgi:hypothetical protein
MELWSKGTLPLNGGMHCALWGCHFSVLDTVCCDTMLIFLDYEIVAMGRRSMNVDVAVMR